MLASTTQIYTHSHDTISLYNKINRRKYGIHHLLLDWEVVTMQAGSPPLICWPSPLVEGIRHYHKSSHYRWCTSQSNFRCCITTQKATKLLKLCPHKKKTVHELKECDSIRIFSTGFVGLHVGEADPQLLSFLTMRAGFPYLEKWILRTGIGVQRIENLFTNFLFMMKKRVTSMW